MPERNFDALDGDDRQMIAHYVPGYDWVPGRFGPPPGIPKARKDEFDRMTDREYLHAFMKLTQEEKESLMVSEAERRRTFAAHWPIEIIVKANDCAREGFYYTGTADRVQCTFCGGIIRNWERGDVPKIQHRNFFNYCKMVQNKPCQNIPINECGIPADLMTNQLSSTRKDARPTTMNDLNINTVKPVHPTLSVYAKRADTFKRYSPKNPINKDKLCEAGFYFEGVGDKVRCFWCDGALEQWSEGDEPWTEHSKWYPGCTFVQQSKGLKFIREAREKMTPANLALSETLEYNRGDMKFLYEEPPKDESKPVDELEGFKFCKDLGYDDEHIKKAYEANNNQEFDGEMVSILMDIVQELADGNSAPLETHRKNVENNTTNAEEPETEKMDTSTANTKPKKKVNISDLITNPNEPTKEDEQDLVAAVKCKSCKKQLAGAVVLPCGCFCLCQDCSKAKLPMKCPACRNVVKGACRIFLS